MSDKIMEEDKALTAIPAYRPTGRFRKAGTLLVLRNSSSGLQVLMEKRSQTMRFLPGYLAFPGGTEDEQDKIIAEQYAIGSPSGYEGGRLWAITAVRETFEEIGLLTALSMQGSTGRIDSCPEQYASVEKNSSSLLEWLRFNEYQLNLTQLRCVGRWIGPHGQPAQFDTWFFAIHHQVDEESFSYNEEVAEVGWQTVEPLVKEIHHGLVKVVPPTRVMLENLSQFETAESAMSQLTAHDPTLSMLDWLEDMK